MNKSSSRVTQEKTEEHKETLLTEATDTKTATKSAVEEKAEEEDAEKEADPIYAERFDFTFSEYFYKHNVNIDEFGERLSIKTAELARIVTQEGLMMDEDEEEEP